MPPNEGLQSDGELDCCRSSWSRGRVDERPTNIDTVRQRNEIGGRLERIQELYEFGDMDRATYVRKRDELQAQLEKLVMPETKVVALAAEQIENLQAAWDLATEAERAEMVRLIFEDIWVDLETGDVPYFKPRPAFLPVFEIVARTTLWPGDPERIRTADLHLDRVAC